MRSLVAFLLFFTATQLLARGSKNAVLVDANYAISYVNPGDINNKILDEKTGVASFIPDVAGISWGHNFGVSAYYAFNYRYYLGLSFDMVYMKLLIAQDLGSMKPVYAEATKVASYYELNTGVLAYGFGPSFLYSIYDRGKLNLSASVSLIYYPSVSYFQDVTYGDSSTDPNLDSNLVQIDGSGSTFGGILTVSGSYYVASNLSISLSLGYKYIMAPALKDQDGNDLYFTWLDGSKDGDSLMNISLGGPFLSLGVRLDFNIGSSDTGSSKAEDNNTDFVSDADEVDMTDSSDFVDVSSDDTLTSQQNVSATDDNVVVRREISITIDDLYRLKAKTSKKYLRFKKRGKYRCSKRMKRLYNIIEKIEIYQWDKLNDNARQEKLEKIQKILESC